MHNSYSRHGKREMLLVFIQVNVRVGNLKTNHLYSFRIHTVKM